MRNDGRTRDTVHQRAVWARGILRDWRKGRRRLGWLAGALAMSQCLPVRAGVLPEESASTTLVAMVREQCRVHVPSFIRFDVDDPARPTRSNAVSLGLSHILLGAPAGSVRLSVKAASATFTPPQPGAATWEARDVFWESAPWSNAESFAGTLSDSVFTAVAVSHPGARACGSNAVTLSLRGKPQVTAPGPHQITLIWKAEVLTAATP